jgi:hypothetical protein
MNGNNRWNFKKEISANNTQEVKCRETVRICLHISVKAMGDNLFHYAQGLHRDME